MHPGSHTLQHLFCWRERCPEAGIDVLYHHGRKLVGDRTGKSRLDVVRLTESQFADDVALYTRTHDELESVARKFVEGACLWGVRVGIEKTKGMVVGEEIPEDDVGPVCVEGGESEMVDHFSYLATKSSAILVLTSFTTPPLLDNTEPT